MPLFQKITQACTVAELTECLKNFHAPNHFEVQEERTLSTWYEVLNRFDDLLETYIKQHELLSCLPRPSSDAINAVGNQARGRSTSAQAANAGSTGGRASRLSEARTSSGVIPSLESILQPHSSDKPSSQSPKNDDTASGRSFAEPLTSDLVFLILKATYRIVKNASYDTRIVYSSMELLTALLGDPTRAIVLISLEILNILLQRSAKLRPTRATLPIGLTDRLHDIAQGWGGRENGLGLVDCCSSLNLDALPALGHSFPIEFRTMNKSKGSAADTDATMQSAGMSSDSISPQGSGSGNVQTGATTAAGEITLLRVPDVRNLKSDGAADEEKWFLTDFMSRYKIPRNKAFALLAGYRRAKVFGSGRNARLNAACEKLLALTILCQLQPPPRPLTELLSKEAELIPDVIALAKADSGDGLDDVPKSLRILAVRCLTGMSLERGRLSTITAAAGIGSHHGTFASLLRSEISTLLEPSDETTAPDGSTAGERMDTDTVESIPAVSALALDAGMGTVDENLPVIQTVQMAEALLSLVHTVAMTGSSSSANALVGSGTLGIIVPLLKDRETSHARAVAMGIRALQGIIEVTHTSSGSQAFRDHDGLVLIADRIAVETLGESEVTGNLEEEDERLEKIALQARGESREMYADLLVYPMTVERALAHQAPSASSASRGVLLHSKWALLRSLHQLFLHALGSGGSQVRDLVPNTALPSALRQILARPFHYGGGLFSVAAMVATAIAHSEPTATAELVKAGIAKAVLKSVSLGLPPYGDAIRCIPNALAAICLAHEARDDIVRASPLRAYVLRLASPFYSRALQGEAPTSIGGALDELMRHVDALRPSGNDAIIEFLTQAAAFVELDISHLRENAGDGYSTPTSSSPTKKSSSGTGSTSRSDKSTAASDLNPSDFVLMERMKLAVAHNAARLAGFSQGSSEHQNAIVRKGGLQEMLKLRAAPAMASAKAYARDSHPSFRASPTPANAIASLASSLRSFSSHHDVDVLRGLFSAIKEDSAKVLRIAASLGNAWLPEEESPNRVILDMRPKPVKAGKESSGKKRARATKRISEEGDVEVSSEMKVDSGPTTDSPRKVPILVSEIKQARADLRNALCVLRVDVVLLSNLSRGGPVSLAGAWEAAGGSAVTALIGVVERSARWHLASVYTGLNCQITTEGDLCTAQVTASASPTLKSASVAKHVDFVPVAAARLGLLDVEHSEFVAACKTVQVLPEKDDPPRQDVKGLAWAMETFVYASQKLYMSLGRGIIFNSRRINREPARYAAGARSLASTIGTLLALHLKAAESLWSKDVVTMGENKVCAAWDYIRRVILEIQSTLFCESNRNTQGLILRFFLSAGGAEVLQRVCRPLSLLEGTRMKLPIPKGVHTDVFAKNKKRFETFLKSNQLPMIYTSIILGEVQQTRNLKKARKSNSGDVQAAAKAGDTDAIMTAVDGEDKEHSSPQTNGTSAGADKNTSANVNLSALREQVTSISDNVLHSRKQALVNRIASDAWSALSSLLLLLSNCPGLLAASPTSLPMDPDSSAGPWEAKDIQRTAQSVTIKLLMDVTREPTELLRACSPGETLTSDVVSIILSILRTSSEISRAADVDSAENRQDSEDVDRGTSDGPPTPSTPNPEHVSWLTEMGFSEARVLEALRQTHPPGAAGVEFALEWLTNNPGPPDVPVANNDDSSDSEDERDGADAPAPEENPAGGETEDTVMNIVQEEGNAAEDAAPEDHGNSSGDDTSPVNEGESTRPAPIEETSEVKSDERNGSTDDKSKREGENCLDIATESDALLTRSALFESNDVQRTIEDMKGLSKPDREAVSKMINAVINFEPKEPLEGAKRKSASTRQISKAKAVSMDGYNSAKKELFDSLVPVAKAAIKHEVTTGSSSHASFVAVEILSVLQKDNCLSSEVRLEFAKVISSELEKFLNAPLSAGRSKNSVVGIRTSFVWAHYGGSQAREALKASGAAEMAFETLEEMSKTWQDLKDTATVVDEEATKPIQHLSINEDVPDEDVVMPNVKASGGKGPGKTSLIVPRKKQAQALQCMDTCLLVLDAFVRYHAKDSLVKHATAKDKDSSAMDVEKGGKSDRRRPRPSRMAVPYLPPTMEDIMRTSENGDDDVSKMDVDGKTEDLSEKLSEISTRVKTQAKEDRKKFVDSCLEEVKSITGRCENQPKLPFSLSDLLSCASKLLSSLAKYDAGDIVIALLQLICSLTSLAELATQFMKDGGVKLLLDLPHIESNRTQVNTKLVRSLVRTALRHVVEDVETLTEAMELELRGLLSQTSARNRSYTLTVSSLIAFCPGMANRNLDCFVRAFGACARARTTPGGPNRGQSEPLLCAEEEETKSMEEWMVESKKRENVVCVVESLTRLLVERKEASVEEKSAVRKEGSDAAGGSSSKAGLSLESLSKLSVEQPPPAASNGVIVFALSQLAELVDLCPVIAAEFLQTESPSKTIEGSVLDYVVQELLPLPDRVMATTGSATSSALNRQWAQQEEVAEAAKVLILSLLSKTANAHTATVKALAKAAEMESKMTDARGGALKSLSLCIIPNTKMRVLKEMLNSGLANSLANSLQKLDMSRERNTEVTTNVLKALSLIGNTATQLSMRGPNNMDDVTSAPQTREMWAAMRDDTRGAFGFDTGFMVL